MRRRDFIALVTAGAAALPSAAVAQANKIHRVGILMLGDPDPASFLQVFANALRELGYLDGNTIALEPRNANGSPERLASLAGELVARHVDVIIGFQTPAVVAAKAATGEIPIIMCPAQEPVELGLVASFARPGGNVTGLTTATADTVTKNVDLIREALPAVRRLGAIGNLNDPFHKPFLESVEAAALKLGFQLRTALAPADALPSTFAELAKGGIEAVLIQPSLRSELAAATAVAHRLPLISPNAEFAAAGALMAYSADTASVYRDAATFVDQILKGRKPADLPVQLPTRFVLAINLKTASALGITLPPTLLARADEVIE